MLLLHSSHQQSIKTSATRPPPEPPSPPYPLLMRSQYCKKKRKEKTKTRRLQVYRSRKSHKHYSIQAEPRFFYKRIGGRQEQKKFDRRIFSVDFPAKPLPPTHQLRKVPSLTLHSIIIHMYYISKILFNYE